MKLEIVLTLVAVLIAIGFVLSRNAYLMGATVFVATPLLVVAVVYYLARVIRELRDHDVL